METSFTSNSKRRVDPKGNAAEAKRGARSSDTIYRRLSRLDLGISPDPNARRNSPKAEASNEKDTKRRSRTRTWFVVIDKSGPLADFATWAQAYRYVATNNIPGFIIRVDEPCEATDKHR